MKKFILAMIILTIFCTFCGAVANSQENEHNELISSLDQTEHIVNHGESLWSIASEYCPDELDKREYIDLVMELNGLTNSAIHPGQRLLVLSE